MEESEVIVPRVLWVKEVCLAGSLGEEAISIEIISVDSGSLLVGF